VSVPQQRGTAWFFWDQQHQFAQTVADCQCGTEPGGARAPFIEGMSLFTKSVSPICTKSVPPMTA